MKFYFFLSLIAANSFVWALPAHNVLLQKLEAIKTLDADFTQMVTLNGRQLSQSNGHLSLKKPGQLNWTIYQPQKQILIADGKHLWIYEPNIQQVSKRDQKNGVGGTAGLLISQQPNLWMARYKVNAQIQKKVSRFQLVAKNPKNSFSKVNLFFSANALEKIEFWDQLGQLSQISFRHIKVNHPLSQKLFTFSVPKNVDVVDLR